MPHWVTAEEGTDTESPDQVMLYYEDDASEYYDNKPDGPDNIEEQNGGKLIRLLLNRSTLFCCFEIEAKIESKTLFSR